MDPDNMECSFQKQTKLKQIRNTYFFFNLNSTKCTFLCLDLLYNDSIHI